MCVCAKLLPSCPTLCDPMTVAFQVPLSMGFSRQEHWSGVPFPSLGEIPDPGIKPESLTSPALAGRFFTTRATWKARFIAYLDAIGLPWWLSGKEQTCKAGDIKTQVQSLGWWGHGNPLQYSCLDNSMDRGVWRAIVHGIAKSQMWLKRLSTHTHRLEAIRWLIRRGYNKIMTD